MSLTFPYVCVPNGSCTRERALVHHLVVWGVLAAELVVPSWTASSHALSRCRKTNVQMPCILPHIACETFHGTSPVSQTGKSGRQVRKSAAI